MKIIVATKNKGKMREIKSILSDSKYEILSMEDIGLDVEVDEDADTFTGNAIKKAVEIMKVCNEITLADDEIVYDNDGIEMLPLRTVAETLGFKVEWVHDTQSVIISKDAFSATIRIGIPTLRRHTSARDKIPTIPIKI